MAAGGKKGRTEIDRKMDGYGEGLAGKADTGLSNLTEDGKDVVRELAKGSVTVKEGKYTTVKQGEEGDARTYTVDLKEEALKEALKPDLDKKADADAGNIDAQKWAEKLGTGTVESGNKDLVTGGSVYDAIKDLATGDSITKSDGDTITIGAKDSATKVDVSDKDGNGRVVTGVATDTSDDTSAANVGYVKDTATDLKRDIQNTESRLTRDIDRAGANAAALAALHPLDYDPDNKLEFAGGYGHYRGANAGALAAFYHPDENVILSLGGTMGNGNPMVNAGVTFKLGPKGHAVLSRTALTNALRKEQEKNKVAMAQIQGLNSKVERLESLVQTLMAKADK